MQRLFFVFLILITTGIMTSSLAFGADFDIETATRAYVDQLQGQELERSNSYFEGGYWLILWGTLVAVIADGLFLKFRWSSKVRDFAERLTGWKWLQPAIYALPYMLVSSLITLPWLIYTEH